LPRISNACTSGKASIDHRGKLPGEDDYIALLDPCPKIEGDIPVLFLTLVTEIFAGAALPPEQHRSRASITPFRGSPEIVFGLPK